MVIERQKKSSWICSCGSPALFGDRNGRNCPERKTGVGHGGLGKVGEVVGREQVVRRQELVWRSSRDQGASTGKARAKLKCVLPQLTRDPRRYYLDDASWPWFTPVVSGVSNTWTDFNL